MKWLTKLWKWFFPDVIKRDIRYSTDKNDLRDRFNTLRSCCGKHKIRETAYSGKILHDFDPNHPSGSGTADYNLRFCLQNMVEDIWIPVRADDYFKNTGSLCEHS